MAFAPMLPYMVGGFAVDKMMGGTGMTGAMLGTGLGAAGGFGGLAGELGLSGVSALPSATAANSLGAGSGLMGGLGTSAGVSALPTAANASLLGSTTGNMIPGYDMGMNGIQANLGGFTGSAYSPITDSMNQAIAPNFATSQANTGLTPNLGTAQTPDYVSSLMTNDPSKQMRTTNVSDSIRDVDGSLSQITQGPNFDNMTKSTPDELASAQGGYQKPLYERAFDSVVGYAEKNPGTVASLGLTALQASEKPKQTPPDSSFARSAGVIKQAYSPTREPMLKVRRA